MKMTQVNSMIQNSWTEQQKLGRALFTRDYDLLQEATKRQRSGVRFSGVIYAHQLRVSIGGSIRDLEIIAKAGEPEDIENRVEFLPL